MEGEADLVGKFVGELEVVGAHDTEGCGDSDGDCDCDGATDCSCPATDIQVVDVHKYSKYSLIRTLCGLRLVP
jgi:hypothetical protein